MRDRDMIPDIPAMSEEERRSSTRNQVFLPPVTVNDYICSQKKSNYKSQAMPNRELPPLIPKPTPKAD